MGIFQRKRTKKNPRSNIQPDYLDELRGLPYAEDFDLPREAAKLARVYEHDISGGSFEVRKTMAGRTKHSPVVAVFSEFPSETQILEAAYESYGGGQYSILLKGQPGPIKTFNFPGRSKFHSQGPPPKTGRQELQDESARYAGELLDKEISSGSELGRQLQQALVAKAYGIKLPEPPAEPTYEEEMLREYLAARPDLEDEYAKMLLRKQGVKFPKEQTDLEWTTDGVRKLVKLKEEIARFERAGEPEPNLARDFLQMLAAVAPDLIGLLLEMKANPAKVPIEPPVPDPQPLREQAKGSESVQDKIGLDTAPVSRSLSVQPSEPAIHQPQDSDNPDEDEDKRLPLNQRTEQASRQPQPDSHTPSTSPDQPTMRSISATFRKEFAGSEDWSELERGINGDPAVYVEHLREKAQKQGTGDSGLLGCLVDPESFLKALEGAVDRLRGEPGRGEDYEVAILIRKYLTDSKEGRRWLEEARATALITLGEMALDIKIMDAPDPGERR